MTPAEFRALHAANPERCSNGCRGWAVFEGNLSGLHIARCDECWHAYHPEVTDDDAATLSEAQSELYHDRSENAPPLNELALELRNSNEDFDGPGEVSLDAHGNVTNPHSLDGDRAYGYERLPGDGKPFDARAAARRLIAAYKACELWSEP